MLLSLNSNAKADLAPSPSPTEYTKPKVLLAWRTGTITLSPNILSQPINGQMPYLGALATDPIILEYDLKTGERQEGGGIHC